MTTRIVRALSAGYAVAALAACSVADETDPEATLHQPLPSYAGEAGNAADGAADATTGDAGTAGAPVPGSACPLVDQVVGARCGTCGKKETICLASSDGGTPTWSGYSRCAGEIRGGCTAGAIETEACGACGTRSRVCSQHCAWSDFGACTNEMPDASCGP